MDPLGVNRPQVKNPWPTLVAFLPSPNCLLAVFAKHFFRAVCVESCDRQVPVVNFWCFVRQRSPLLSHQHFGLLHFNISDHRCHLDHYRNGRHVPLARHQAAGRARVSRVLDCFAALFLQLSVLISISGGPDAGKRRSLPSPKAGLGTRPFCGQIFTIWLFSEVVWPQIFYLAFCKQLWKFDQFLAWFACGTTFQNFNIQNKSMCPFTSTTHLLTVTITQVNPDNGDSSKPWEWRQLETGA